MAEPKTRRTKGSVAAYIAALPSETTRRDCKLLQALIEDVTKEKAAMWGPSIVGCGTYDLVYANGKTAEWPVAAFSARKNSLVLYIMPLEGYDALLAKLGPHSRGKSCLYVKSLDQVHLPTLKTIVRQSVKGVRQSSKARAKQA